MGRNGPKRETAFCLSPYHTTPPPAREQRAGFDWATPVEMPMVSRFSGFLFAIWRSSLLFLLYFLFLCKNARTGRRCKHSPRRPPTSLSTLFTTFLTKTTSYTTYLTCSLHDVLMSAGQEQQLVSCLFAARPLSPRHHRIEKRGANAGGGGKCKVHFRYRNDSGSLSKLNANRLRANALNITEYALLLPQPRRNSKCAGETWAS